MKIMIIGNGGAVNEGLEYNSSLINDSFLVELPPDIMVNLKRLNINIDHITNIFISHFHGDHYFGFPFIALDHFYNNKKINISIFGPVGVKQRLLDLTKISFGESHPVINWINNYFKFIEFENNDYLNIDDFKFKIFKVKHIIDTYGFFTDTNLNRYIYLPDTVWNSKFNSLFLEDKCNHVLIDLNGEDSDMVKVHISESDLISVIANLNLDIIFYGTHLKMAKLSKNSNIQYPKVGEVIDVE